eukprot:7260851-Pyramimonas_sp.AAC.1
MQAGCKLAAARAGPRGSRGSAASLLSVRATWRLKVASDTRKNASGPVAHWGPLTPLVLDAAAGRARSSPAASPARR